MTSCKRDPATGLTVQQEKFCLGLAKGMSQAAAYRHAYPRSVTWKPQIVYQRASELAADGKVQGRVAELHAEVRQRTGYDLAQAMQETGEVLRRARARRDVGAMIAIVTLRARMNGLLTGERRNERRPLQDLTDEELEAVITRAERDLSSTLR